MSNKILLSNADGVLTKDLQVPRSTGGFWPHLVDLYVPTIEGPMLGALICLHGGGGNKRHFAYGTGLVRYGRAHRSSSVRWQSLVTSRTVFAFPQGQAPIGLVNEFNPNGIDTRTPSYPNGVPAWANYDMYSDYDDAEFLEDLGEGLETTFNLNGVNLAGHSAGGIMVQRMWREATYSRTNWRRFISLAGPRAFAQSKTDAPSKRPFLLQVGTADPNLNNTEVGMFVPQWVGLNQGRVFYQPAGPIRRGMFADLQSTVDLYNTSQSLSAETVAVGDATVGPTGVSSWTYGGGKITLQHYPDVGHKPAMFWKQMLTRTYTNWILWMSETPV